MLRVICSGGGSKGAFYAGFVKAKEEFGIFEDERWGTSIGGVNMILQGLGYNLEEVWMKYFRNESIVVNAIIAFFLGYDIYEAATLRPVFEKLIGKHTVFSNLNCRTFVTASNIKGKTQYTFGYAQRDNLLKAALATSAYPIIFKPIEYMDMLLVDGCLANNLPIPPWEDLCPTDVTIAIVLGRSDDSYITPEYPHLHGVAKKLAEATAMWNYIMDSEYVRELDNWNESKYGKLIKIYLDDPEEIFSFDFSKTEKCHFISSCDLKAMSL